MNSVLSNFIIKALCVFVIWYMLYEQWILPDGRLDYWVSINTIEISGGLFQKIGFEIFTVNRIIGIQGAAGIKVIDGCNGISAMGLFSGFILAYPSLWKNKLVFMVLGLLVIYLVNILRIVSLVYTQWSHPEYFNFMHEYSTTTLFYIIVFLLWMEWVRANQGYLNNQWRGVR